MILLVFVSAAILFVGSQYVQKPLLSLVNGKIPGHVSMEKLKINIFAGQIGIAGFQVQGPDERSLIRVGKLSIDLAWMRLLKGEVFLSSILIDSPEFDLSMGEDGSLDLIGAFIPADSQPSSPENETASPGLPVNIIINEFAFTRGNIAFALPENEVNLLLSGINIAISDFNLFNESVRFRGGFDTGKFIVQGRPIVVNSFGAEAILGDGGLSGIMVQTVMDGVDLKIHGSIKDVLKAPFLDISMGSRVDLARAALLAGMEAQVLSGVVGLDLSVKGDLENPGVQISIHSKEAGFKEYALQNFKFDSRMKDWLVTLEPSGFSSKQGNLSLGGVINLGKAFPKGLQGAAELDEIFYDLDAVLDGVALSALPEAGLPKKGLLASRINFQGRGIDPEKMKADIKAQLNGKGLWFQGMPEPVDADFQADIGLDRFKAGIRSVNLTSPGIALTGHGSVDIPGREIEGHLDLEAADIGLLAGLTGVQGRGNIKVSAEIDGSFSGPTASLSVLAANLGMNDILIGNLVLNAGLDQTGRISLDRFSLENKTSSVRARGWADLMGKAKEGESEKLIHFDLDLEKLDPVNFMASSPLGGDFNGKIMLGGTISEPVAALEITGKDLTLNKNRGGDASVKMGISNGMVDIENFQIALGKSLIKGVGQARILDKNFALIKDPDIQLALDGASVFLEDFFPDITGHLSLDGKVKGRPSDMAGYFNIEGDSFGIGGQKIDGLSSKLLIKGQVVKIDQLDIKVSPGSLIQAKGQVVPLDQTFDIRVDSKNFDLTSLDQFEKNGGNGGRLSLDLSARGSFKDPAAKGHLSIQELVLLEKKQAPMDFWIELKNRQLGVKGNLGPDVEGSYHLDTQAFTAALDMDRFDLSPYFSLMGQPQLTGGITGSIRAEGQADQLLQTRASAKFSKIKVDFADKPLVGLADANLTVEKGRFHLSPVKISLMEKGSLTVKGDGDFSGALDVDLQGDIPLEVIEPLVDEIKSATGQIRMSASLKGSMDAPLIRGEVQLNGLGMAMRGIEQDLKNVEGVIKFTPDKIEILGFKGYLDQGRFDLGGSVGLKEWAVENIDMEVNAHQMYLEIPDMMELSFNCGLKLSGTDAASALTGEIVLLEGRYYKDVDLISAATERKRKVAPLDKKEPSEFLKNIGINVHVVRREPLLVDNNLAYLAISPNLTVKGTAAAPLLAGRAEVDSGYIKFQRTEFEVKKGVIDFLNPYKIEPTIDISGETDIRNWTITLAVSGVPDNLEFNLSSNPSETDGDILSLIALGKTTRELRAADGGGGFAMEDILAGMMADSLEKNLKDATGLDHLEINANDKDDTGERRVNVTVGTDLSREITVKYGVDVRNGETVYRVTTDYKLLEKLLVSGYQDTGGTFGGELKYRLEFR